MESPILDIDSSDKYFVRIHIAATRNTSAKEFRLSRFQFEILFFSIPVILIWGVFSTLILIKTLYVDRPLSVADRAQVKSSMARSSASDLASLSTPTVITEEPKKPSAQIEPEETTSTVIPIIKSESNADANITAEIEAPTEKTTTIALKELAARSFRVDDIFQIDFVISKKTPKPSYVINIGMTNLKGEAETGRYWVSVLARTESGKKVWLTPMPEVKINSAGQAENPKRGWAYDFRYFRKSELELKNVKSKIDQFDEVMIGFQRNGKSPAIAKVQLGPR